ncbi:hypothetical protein SDRG_10774 [Saprolegnia diclina VS20]|uniref:RING-type domain-containing protein n=1 Tax=Saprolegnia diclina (strain VS20) TaxID=1156394 RepID=T0QAB5_SAPDV|nr:hypothetical protein SDRG_10774 [Saprolegnia diclina VS20]EQC31606.1 hypothetical protein SDRG_10774 [Saprolegnia diclina VS20]|eukprot:XP_008615005.1 hypothetical protein SDRG_10774 [Saprolegnia diclina VS20]
MATEEASDWAEARDEGFFAVDSAEHAPTDATSDVASFDSVDSSSDTSALHGACPVCLKPLVDGVLVAACLHEFCRACILQWVDHLRDRGAPVRCPICRTPFAQLYTNVVSAEDYDVEDLATTAPSPRSLARRQRALVYRRASVSIDDARRMQWPVIYKTNDQAMSWIRRELGVVLGAATDTSLLTQIIASQLVEIRMDDASRKRKHVQHGYERLVDALHGFLDDDAATFVVELSRYMASRLNLAAYDEQAFSFG